MYRSAYFHPVSVAIISVAIGVTVLLGRALYLEDSLQWGALVLLVLAAVAGMPPVRPGRSGTSSSVLMSLSFVFINLAMVWLCLGLFGAYNSILMLGGWFMLATLLRHYVRPFAKTNLQRYWFFINILVSGTLLLSAPDINGVKLSLPYLQTPVIFGLFSEAESEYRLVERSQDYRTHSYGKPVQVSLHSPLAGNRTDRIRLLLKPHRPGIIRLNSVHMINYVGFDTRVVAKYQGESLARVLEQPPDKNYSLKLRDGIVEIDSENSSIWIDLPLNQDSAKRRASPARTGNSLRALAYWQVGWFLILMLAPWRRSYDAR